MNNNPLPSEPPSAFVANYNSKHKRNCTVVALAATTGLPYDEAHRIAEKAGRLLNKGFRSEKLIKYFNAKHGRNQFRKVKRTTITLQKFCKKYPRGSFYVRKKGHAYAVIDGVVVDCTRPKSLERIKEAWRFIGDLSKSNKETTSNEN